MVGNDNRVILDARLTGVPIWAPSNHTVMEKVNTLSIKSLFEEKFNMCDAEFVVQSSKNR